MIIKLGRRNKSRFTDEQIELAKKSIERWDMVSQVLTAPGWELIAGHLAKLNEINDKVSNLEIDEMLYRKGYVAGLRVITTYLESIKTVAQTARQILDASTETKE